MPAAQRLLAERGLRPEAVRPSGPGGRLLKEDVLRHVGRAPDDREKEPAQAKAPAMMPEPLSQREEEAVAMSPMRRRIAQRLVEAQQTAALLTTSTKSTWRRSSLYVKNTRHSSRRSTRLSSASCLFCQSGN